MESRKPYYQDLHGSLYNMNFLDNDLENESIQMVVTSPPYWGLRKYSGEQDLIWGENHCRHEWVSKEVWAANSSSNSPGKQQTNKGTIGVDSHRTISQTICSICGSWRGAYGLEPTPEMYVDHTIEILREIRRVLRKDGVVFWNIGDSYAGSGMGAANYPGDYPKQNSNTGTLAVKGRKAYKDNIIKPKDLCLIPFRVAIAAQTDGWWVRSVIIWNKPNPMPESATDRPTESHEYILMLTKSAKYYWDADAVRMPIAESTIGRGKVDFGGAKGRDYQPTADDPNYRAGNEQWGRTYEYKGGYPEAHFAVFPEKLPETCIKAATPEVGCCSKCGKPWERMVEVSGGNYQERKAKGVGGPYNLRPELMNEAAKLGSLGSVSKTLGWQSTCKCNAESVPSVVLDPFAGAGTTLWVAKKLNRKAVGYELSEEYCQLIKERNSQQVLI
jgi:DNA modification methylase